MLPKHPAFPAALVSSDRSLLVGTVCSRARMAENLQSFSSWLPPLDTAGPQLMEPQNTPCTEGKAAGLSCWGEATPQYPLTQKPIPTPTDTGRNCSCFHETKRQEKLHPWLAQRQRGGSKSERMQTYSLPSTP